MSSFFLYQQVKDNIIAMIENHRLKPGDRIPSERELSRKFNIGRMTIRQGITELVNEGVLYRVQGRGTFVNLKPIRQPLGKLMSFTEEIRNLGYEPGAKLIDKAIIEADHEIALNLKIRDKEKVIKAVRLRFVDNEIFSLNFSYFSYEKFPEIMNMDLGCLSLYKMIEEKLGFKIKKAVETLGATSASNDVAKIMKIKKDTPLLLMKRTTYVMKDTPIEFVRVFFLPDKYNFEIQLSK
ncbi:MAG: GntR family transcriptional regulator [Thermotogae bacterium]|nr:GntR family transcriptional regulator [Thermotogota bacterium]